MVGDREASRALSTMVEGLDECYFVTGSWFGGSTTRIRAILAAALGEQEEAEYLFGRAEAGFDVAQSPPWLARTRVEWAEHCLAHGNGVRARELAASALGAVGLTVTRSRAEAVLDGLAEPN